MTPVLTPNGHVTSKEIGRKPDAGRVAAVNDALTRLAAEHGIRMTDVGRMLDADHQLRADYTSDGVHLTLDGYRALSEAWELCRP